MAAERADKAERPEILSLDDLWLVDQICDAFESILASGQAPVLDQYLSQITPRLRAPLIEELLLLEWHYLELSGQKPQVAAYLERYPEFGDSIAGAWLRFTEISGSDAKRRESEDGNQSTTVEFGLDGLASNTWPPADPVGDDSQSCEGRTIGRFQLVKLLGTGSFGAVYLAHDPQLDRDVALKVPHGNLPKKYLHRFLREARAAAQLRHPNIVPIYDAGQINGAYYIASGFIEGKTLREVMRDRALGSRATSPKTTEAQGVNVQFSKREATVLLSKLAAALHYAHTQGIVHRDIKPDNIMVDESGEPHVMDFGLARRDEGEELYTREGVVMGTAAYMSPEQARGENRALDGRSDQWSLGVLLYELLTGQRPFQGKSFETLLRDIVEREPLPPRKCNPSISRDLDTICQKCLAKDRIGRYENCGLLSDELGRYLRGEPILARRISSLEHLARWCRRKPLAASLIASLMLCAIAVTTATILAQRARHLASVSQAVKRLDAKLEGLALSPEYLQSAQDMLHVVSDLSPDDAMTMKQKFFDRIVLMIDQELSKPRLDVSQLSKIESALAHLERQSLTSQVKALRERLAKRNRSWRNVFELHPPFAMRHEVFAPEQIRVEENYFTFMPPVDVAKPTTHAGNVTRIANFTCTSNSLLKIEFTATWQDATMLGLGFVGDEATGYFFRLQAPQESPPNVASQTRTTFRELRQVNGECELVILRDNLELHRHRFPVRQIAPINLSIEAKKEAGRLQLLVNDLKPMEFEDAFPLPVKSAAHFSVECPPEVKVTGMRAATLQLGETPSPLERADEQYAAGQFAAALAEYQQLAATVGDKETRQESLYKQALCLAKVHQVEDSHVVLNELASEAGTRWPPRAAVLMWVNHIHQQRFNDADAIFDRLGIEFDQLVSIVPLETRKQLVAHYGRQANATLGDYLQSTSRIDDLQRVLQLYHLLGADNDDVFQAQIKLVQALEDAGRLPEALEASTKLVTDMRQTSQLPIVLRVHIRLLRLHGRTTEAIALLDTVIDELGLMQSDELPILMPLRAICLVEDGRIQDAEKDLDTLTHYAASLPPEKYAEYRAHEGAEADLLRGYLKYCRNDQAGALTAWRHGLPLAGLTNRPSRGNRPYVMLRCVSGDFDDGDRDMVLNEINIGTAVPLLKFAKPLLDSHSLNLLTKAWQDGFRSPRGRKWVEKYILRMTSRRDEVRTTLLIPGHAFLVSSLFPHGHSPQQDELVWKVCEIGIKQALDDRTLDAKTLMSLALAWRSSLTSTMGWEAAAKQATPELLGGGAYCLAHRYLQQGDVESAKKFFARALTYRDASPLAAQLADQDLGLLESQQGIVCIDFDFPDSAETVFRRENDPQTPPVTCRLSARYFEQQLAAGKYHLEISTTGLKAFPSEIEVTPMARQVVRVGTVWKSADRDLSLPGLIPRPAQFEGIPRWQIESRLPRGRIARVRFNSAGDMFANSSNDGRVRIYDSKGETLRRVIPIARHRVEDLAWNSSNPNQLITCVPDKGMLSLWDVSTGRFVRDYLSGARRTFDGECSIGGDIVVARGLVNDSLSVWRATGEALATVRHPDSIVGVAIHPEGGQIATICKNHSEIWLHHPDGTAGSNVRNPSGNPTAIAWSTTGMLASGDVNAKCHLWDATTGKLVAELKLDIPGPAPIHHLAWSHSGHFLAAVTDAGQVAVFDINDQKTLFTKALGADEVLRSDWSGDDSHLITVGYYGATHRLSLDGEVTPILRSQRMAISAICLHPTQPRLLVATETGAYLFSLEENVLPKKIATPSSIQRAAWSPDGRQFALVCDHVTLLVNEDDATPIRLEIEPDRVLALAWSPDGDQLALGLNNKVQFWRRDGSLDREWKDLPQAVTSLAWQFNQLAVGFPQQNKFGVQLFDPTTGKLSTTLNEQADMFDICWSPDGSTLATPGSGRGGGAEVVLWSGTTRISLCNSQHLPHGLTAIAWHPSNKMLATAGPDRRIFIWTTDGKLLHDITGHQGTPRALAWTADGKHLLSAGDDHTIRVWDTETGEPTKVYLLLDNDQCAIFAGSGEPLFLSANAETSLVALTENADGGLDFQDWKQFQDRVTKTLTKSP